MPLVIDCSTWPERERGIKAAVSAIRRGDLVVIPTESVYALMADPFSALGVGRIRTAKGRGRDLPLPICVGRPRMVEGIATGLTPDARALIEGFWPGPLTLVAREQPTLAWDIGDTQGTVAVRMPLHPVALDVITQSGPVIVTSANRAGAAQPRSCAEAQAQFGDDVAVYLDAGQLLETEPSSVVDVTCDIPALLRAGAFSLEVLREVCPDLTDAAL